MLLQGWSGIIQNRRNYYQVQEPAEEIIFLKSFPPKMATDLGMEEGGGGWGDRVPEGLNLSYPEKSVIRSTLGTALPGTWQRRGVRVHTMPQGTLNINSCCD